MVLCVHADARRVLLSSFLNLKATVQSLEAEEEPFELLLVCSGTNAQTALEDCLCAGALCELFWKHISLEQMSDSAIVAHTACSTENQRSADCDRRVARQQAFATAPGAKGRRGILRTTQYFSSVGSVT